MVSRDGNAHGRPLVLGRISGVRHRRAPDAYRHGADAHRRERVLHPVARPLAEVRVYGANFPVDLKPADFDFGKGITVKRVVKRTPNVVTIEVQADAGLPAGIRNFSMRQASPRNGPSLSTTRLPTSR